MNLANATPPADTATQADAPRIWYPEGHHHRPTRRARVQHSFHTHPLLQLDALRDLAKRVAANGQTKFLSQGTKADSAFNTLTAHDGGRSIDDVFERISDRGSWISIYNVATDPAYRDMLWAAMNSARPFVEPLDPGMYNIDGFVFISAPPSVTPFHIDRENNFLIQIRGRKRFRVWEPDDRQTVPQRSVEQFIVFRDLHGVTLTDSVATRALDVELGPGEGIYMPSTSAHLISTDDHWVTADDGISITIGIVFYTNATRKAANIHALNMSLRKLGIEPAEPGHSPLDGVKYPLAKAYVAASKAFRGFTPPPGF
jgi:Cupin-like domain